MEEVKPVRIHVHPDLEEEFKYWKAIFEKKAGREIDGGRPTISKFCAIVLKELRLKEPRQKKHIIIEIRKIPRIGKCEVSFL